MGAYLSAADSSKETTSGVCTAMNLRWSTCSMQGWRVSMEDSHLVLYAKTCPRLAQASLGADREAPVRDSSGPKRLGLEAETPAESPPRASSGPKRLGPETETPAESPVRASSRASQPRSPSAEGPTGASASASGLLGSSALAVGPDEKIYFQWGEATMVKRLGRVQRRSSGTVGGIPVGASVEVNAEEEEKAVFRGEEEEKRKNGVCRGGTARRSFRRRRRSSAGEEEKGIAEEEDAIPEDVETGDVKLALFAVFDGHGGAHVARFAAERLPQALLAQDGFRKGHYGAALRGAYLEVDEQLREASCQEELHHLAHHPSAHRLRLEQNALVLGSNGSFSRRLNRLSGSGLVNRTFSFGGSLGEGDKRGGSETPEEAPERGVSRPASWEPNAPVREAAEKPEELADSAERARHEETAETPSEACGGSAGATAFDSESSSDGFFIPQPRSPAAGVAGGADASQRRSCPRLRLFESPEHRAPDEAPPGVFLGGDRSDSRGDAEIPGAPEEVAVAAAPAFPPAEMIAAREGTVSADRSSSSSRPGARETAHAGSLQPSRARGFRASFAGLLEAVRNSLNVGRFFKAGAGNAQNPLKSLASLAGCTAITVFVTPSWIIVGNVGDSRCVLCRGDEAVELSRDHKPQLPEERIRIYAAGGYLEMGRVNGNLNLSRALGDLVYKQDSTLPPEKQIVSAVPDVVSVHRDAARDEFLIIGCDGIWELLSSQEVVDFIRKRIEETPDLSQILQDLLDSLLSPNPAVFEYGCDNMTAILVDLKPNMRSYRSSTMDSGSQISRLHSFRRRGSSVATLAASTSRLKEADCCAEAVSSANPTSSSWSPSSASSFERHEREELPPLRKQVMCVRQVEETERETGPGGDQLKKDDAAPAEAGQLRGREEGEADAAAGEAQAETDGGA
ncbi:protein phosphatase 2C domain-containing protein [Toxoplasma gondii VAND]|uniref:Protein phosphatase 2C domain-containing protein n=1 Tax=Toxoplasma gondii VAND TaxID=933077 RepID=A0A086PN26_TOXGO|nr:protein phosphatase 2C domain-containing protein [Toxoplasma gondii VAND]